MSSGTDFGSNSKMADFSPQNFLSGHVTATDVEKLKKKELILVAKELDAELQTEGKAKAKVNAILLQALAEENLLKGTMRTRGLESELELQLELKRLKLEEKRERQRRYGREKEEREAESQREEAERQRQFEVEQKERELQRQKELARE